MSERRKAHNIGLTGVRVRNAGGHRVWSVRCSLRAASVAISPLATVAVVTPQRKALTHRGTAGNHAGLRGTQLFARVPGYVRLFHENNGRIIHDIGQKIPVRNMIPSGKEWSSLGKFWRSLSFRSWNRANLKKALVRQAEADVAQTQKTVAQPRRTSR